MLIDKFVVRLMKRIVRCSTIIHSMYWKCPGTSIFHSFTQHRNTVLPQIINIDSSLSLSIKLFDAFD